MLIKESPIIGIKIAAALQDFLLPSFVEIGVIIFSTSFSILFVFLLFSEESPKELIL